MSAQDPRMMIHLAESDINTRLERMQIEREIRLANQGGFAFALRHQVSANLVRLGGWVKPATGIEPANEPALIRSVR